MAAVARQGVAVAGTRVAPRRAARSACGAGGPAGRAVVVRANRLDQTGFIEEDNSGRANIFAVEPKQLYTKSATAEKAASQGIGGLAGVALLLGVVAAVGFGTKLVSEEPAVDPLSVAIAFDGAEPLSAYLERFTAP